VSILTMSLVSIRCTYRRKGHKGDWSSWAYLYNLRNSWTNPA
jgi:hypothetical protein